MKKEAFKPTENELSVLVSVLVSLRWFYTCKLREQNTETEVKKYDRLHTAANLLCETILKEDFNGDYGKAFALCDEIMRAYNLNNK